MAGRARPKLRKIHRSFLSAVARDMTAATMRKRAVVLAPHPDDETIGCGGTIIRKRDAGADVHVVIAADGANPVRRAESIEACRRLGVDAGRLEHLGFDDGGLAAAHEELVASLRELFARTDAEEVFVPSVIDNHPDHRALARAASEAAASALPRADLFAYPVWFWNRWSWADRSASPWHQRAQLVTGPLQFTATTIVRKVDISDVVDRKREALAAHVSQVGPNGTGGDQFLDPVWLETFLRNDEVFFAVRRGRLR